MQVKNILIVGIVLCMSQVGLAQNGYFADGEVQDAEIVIEKQRKIELQKQVKLYEFIKWTPERKKVSVAPYTFNMYKYNVANEPMAFRPARAKVQGADESYQHYLKAGFGNYASPLIDLSLSTAGDANRMLGVNIKHYSFGKGEVDGKNSGAGATEVNLYGALIGDKVKLESELNYRLDNNYYYGYPTGTVVNNDSIKHNANFLNIGMDVLDNNFEDSWNYKIGGNFQHYSDNFDASENSFLVDGGVGFGGKMFLDANMILSTYQDLGINESRSYWRVNPYYRLELDALKLDVGMSVSGQSDVAPDLNTTKFFPFARATYGLTDQYSVYATIDGGYTFNSMFDLALNMPVLNQSVTLINSERLFDFSGGIKGNPIDKLSLAAEVGFQTIRYLPIFLNNAIDQSRIDIGYDPEKTNLFTFKATAQYKISEAHLFGLGANFYSYSSDSYNQIYHRPNMEISVSGDHMLFDKLSANWKFTYTGGLVARDQVTDQDVDLNGIPKLDISLHYQLNERFGVFLSGENLINKNYSRYLYYPQRGIMIKGGITVRL